MSLTVDITEEKISELTDITIEMIQFEAKREKRWRGRREGQQQWPVGHDIYLREPEKLVGEGHRKREAGRKNYWKLFQNYSDWTSLVAQWLRILPPMQGTQVRALVREDPTCHGATKPVRHNYWACALEPASHNYWARVPQLLQPVCLEPVLCNKQKPLNEKAAHSNKE